MSEREAMSRASTEFHPVGQLSEDDILAALGVAVSLTPDELCELLDARRSTTYFVEHYGKHVGAKLVVQLAWNMKFPDNPIAANSFRGDRDHVARPLEALGFVVADKDPERLHGARAGGTSGSLGEGFARLLEEFGVAVREPFKSHPVGNFVRGELAETVRRVVDDRLLVKGSVGNGNWAETPWVAVFDPRVTTSAQRGVYVVYLFDSDGQHLYLSLNQATTEVRKEAGRHYTDVLESRAELAREVLEPYGTEDLLLGPLQLSGSGDLTRGYCAGNIAAFEYHRGQLPSEAGLTHDLLRLLSLYQTYLLVRTGDLGQEEELPSDIDSATEARRFRWHRRAERNRSLAMAAKKFHGTVCMVCGFDFEARYGELGAGYIEAHHVVPFADLVKEPEPVLLNPMTDFVVVCANCHRMLHRRSPALSPAQLNAMLKPSVGMSDSRSSSRPADG